jgi:ATP-dependent DNA ligase
MVTGSCFEKFRGYGAPLGTILNRLAGLRSVLLSIGSLAGTAGRRLRAKSSPPFPLRYADHIAGSGTTLFLRVCELDLEGIVANHKVAPYVTERGHSTWFKVPKRSYSQKEGREELFERDRHREPVPGWHA